MKAIYCTNETLRKWNLGPDFQCNGGFDKCKYAVTFGDQPYCGYCPGRCGLHQIIKGQAGCLFCKYVVKNLDSKKCFECLSAETRINYDRTEEQGELSSETNRL